MSVQRYMVDGSQVTKGDREVIAVWPGQPIPLKGDFDVDLSRKQYERFIELLKVLRLE